MQSYRPLVIRAALALALAAAAAAQPQYVVSPVPQLQFLDNNGKPLQGCVATYAAGTTTPLTTAKDASGTPNTNPVILNSSGRADIWIGATVYKFVVKQKTSGACSLSSGTVLYTVDNISDEGLLLRGQLTGANGANTIGYQPAGGNNITIGNVLNMTIPDVGYTTFTSACTAASAAAKTLVVSRHWTALTTQTCAAALDFLASGQLQPAAGATVTLTGTVTAPAEQNIFDISTGGSILFGQNAVAEDWVTWFGADATGAAESAPQIQAAIDACYTWTGSLYAHYCVTRMPLGNFRISTTIRGYGLTHSGSYTGFSFHGASQFSSILSWYGPSGASALQTIGAYQSIGDMQIVNQNAAGWRSCWDYGGDAVVAFSTGSNATNLFCEGSGYPGDGVTMGRNGFQSDSLTLVNPKIENLPSGKCLYQMSTNTQGLTVQGGDITNCWVMWWGAGNTNQAHFSNTNVVLNGVDFFGGGPGASLLVDNVRSERGKRVFFSTAGAYYSPTTFNNFFLATNITARAATTVTAAAGAQDLILSTNSFVMGDHIVIAGGGAGGANLQTFINNASDPTHVHIEDALGASVTGASVTYDTSVQQYAFIERANGPFVHTGGYIQTDSGGEIELAAQGTQTFTGVGWKENLTNPANRPANLTCLSGISWTGLYSNGESGSPAKIPDFIPAQNAVNTLYPTTVYVTAGTGSANNAIVATTNMWCTPQLHAGLVVTLATGAYSLQAGANTFSYAGSGAAPIFKHSEIFTNIPTPYQANSLITLVWSPFNIWLDMSQ